MNWGCFKFNCCFLVCLLNCTQVYFESDEVHACIVTCGGLCPGLNTVIREIVCGLAHMYGVTKILGIEVCSFFLTVFVCLNQLQMVPWVLLFYYSVYHNLFICSTLHVSHYLVALVFGQDFWKWDTGYRKYPYCMVWVVWCFLTARPQTNFHPWCYSRKDVS